MTITTNALVEMIYYFVTSGGAGSGITEEQGYNLQLYMDNRIK